MKRHLLAVAVLAVGVANVGAEVTRDQAKKVVPSISKNQLLPGPKLGPPIDNLQVPKPFLSIAGLRASRSLDMKTALVEATIRNDNLRTVTGAQYFLEHWTGSAWRTVKQGVVNINGRGAANVYAYVAVSIQAQHFRIRVPQSVEGSRQMRLVGTIFVLTFRCPEWQEFGRTIGRDGESLASVRARAQGGWGAFLRSKGFEVAYSVLPRDKYFTVVTLYRAPSWVTREFTNLRDAEDYLKNIKEQGIEKRITTRND